MLHFTLDVFDIEPEVKEKIKGLVEKNNKKYKERNHKWNFEENLGFFNINCHTSSWYYLTELKNILFNEVQEDQYNLEVDFGEEVLGTAYILEEKVIDNMEEPEEETFNRFELLIVFFTHFRYFQHIPFFLFSFSCTRVVQINT